MSRRASFLYAWRLGFKSSWSNGFSATIERITASSLCYNFGNTSERVANIFFYGSKLHLQLVHVGNKPFLQCSLDRILLSKYNRSSLSTKNKFQENGHTGHKRYCPVHPFIYQNRTCVYSFKLFSKRLLMYSTCRICKRGCHFVKFSESNRFIVSKIYRGSLSRGAGETTAGLLLHVTNHSWLCSECNEISL